MLDWEADKNQPTAKVVAAFHIKSAINLSQNFCIRFLWRDDPLSPPRIRISFSNWLDSKYYLPIFKFQSRIIPLQMIHS
jgi:hypothetical protein